MRLAGPLVLASACALAAPRSASACPSSRRASSSSSSRRSEGFAILASVIEAVVAAPTAGTGRGAPRRTRYAGPPLELYVGAEYQSLDLASATFRGWDLHPALANYVGSSQSAGGAFGLGRIALAGVAGGGSVNLGRHFTLGLRFAYFGQVDRNGFAPGSDVMYTSRARIVEAGGDVGLIFPVGLVTLRAELFLGVRRSTFRVEDIGFAGCTTVPEIESSMLLARPRATVMFDVAPAVGLGAFVGADPFRPGDVQTGVVFAIHTRGYGTTP